MFSCVYLCGNMNYFINLLSSCFFGFSENALICFSMFLIKFKLTSSHILSFIRATIVTYLTFVLPFRVSPLKQASCSSSSSFLRNVFFQYHHAMTILACIFQHFKIPIVVGSVINHHCCPCNLRRFKREELRV